MATRRVGFLEVFVPEDHPAGPSAKHLSAQKNNQYGGGDQQRDPCSPITLMCQISLGQHHPESKLPSRQSVESMPTVPKQVQWDGTYISVKKRMVIRSKKTREGAGDAVMRIAFGAARYS